MRRLYSLVFLGVLTAACNNNSGVPLTAEQLALQNYLRLKLGVVFGANFANVTSLLPLLGDPEALAAAGGSFEPDDSPGAEPNTFLFNIPADTDGDGTNDATFSGSAKTSGDPFGVLGEGFTIDLDIMIVFADGGSFNAMLALRVGLGSLEVSGSGSFVDALEGFEATFSIDPAAPVVIRGDAEGDGNFCEADVEGDVNVEVMPTGSSTTGPAAFPPGALRAIYRALFGSPTIRVTNASFNDPEMGEQSLPDSTISTPPCGQQSIAQEWSGAWAYSFFCPPDETGDDMYSITVQGPNTLRVIVNGGELDYVANLDPTNQRRATGFFIDTDDGGTYREDFVWTLSADGAQWSQTSHYEYSSGPLAGTGGDCTATAVR